MLAAALRVFFYIYASLVCSCVQIQRDALSTKGVKINVLFTFILTVTQQAFGKQVKNFLLPSLTHVASGAARNGVTVISQGRKRPFFNVLNNQYKLYLIHRQTDVGDRCNRVMTQSSALFLYN